MTKVVFITGASSGIGRACAIAFAKAGYKVAGTARREEKLLTLRDEIKSITGSSENFLPLMSDVSDKQSVDEAVAKTIDVFGQLDVLIANAGVGHRGALVEADWAEIEALLRTNIDGVLHSIRATVPAMQKADGGHIVTISSVSFNLVSPMASIYAASKAFVSSMANSLRLELEDDNIKVTDFLVGRTATGFNDARLGEGARNSNSVPNMTPDKVAEAVLKAVGTNKQTVTLRFFDKLLVWGNVLFPNRIGRIVKKEYS